MASEEERRSKWRTKGTIGQGDAGKEEYEPKKEAEATLKLQNGSHIHANEIV